MIADAEGLPRLTTSAKLRLVAEILGVYVVVRWRMRGRDIRIVVERLGDGQLSRRGR